jgi:hypothetical protein
MPKIECRTGDGLANFAQASELASAVVDVIGRINPTAPQHPSPRPDEVSSACLDPSCLSALELGRPFRRGRRTVGQFLRGVVTTYALEIGVAADCDNRDQSLSAFLATRCSIHEMILPDYSSLTRNGNLRSRTLRTGTFISRRPDAWQANSPRLEIWGLL